MKKFRNLYHSLAPNPEEIEAIALAKPKCVLISFGNRWNEWKVEDFIAQIGYAPVIMVDSGAFSFKDRDQGTEHATHLMAYDQLEASCEDNDVDPEYLETDEYYDTMLEMYGDQEGVFFEFTEWLAENRQHIDYIISMDKIGDPEHSWWNWKILTQQGWDVIPVFHYGTDFEVLDRYVSEGADYICLGGSVMEKKRNKKAEWAATATQRYPKVNFHLLGCQDLRVVAKCAMTYSSDGTAWCQNGWWELKRLNQGMTRTESNATEIKRLDEKFGTLRKSA